MQKDVLKNLLKKFSKSKLPQEMLENVLEAPEDILNIIAKLDLSSLIDAIIIVNNLLDNNISSSEIKIGLNMYLESLDYQKKYFYNLLTDNFTSKNKLVLKSLNILKKCPNECSLKSAYKAITNHELYNLGINLKMAEIISEVKLKDSLDYIERLYLDKENMETQNLLESARIIASSSKSFNAHYAYFILNRKSINNVNKQYEAARLINMAENEYNAHYADIILKHYMPLDMEFALQGAKIILWAKEVYQAHYVEELLLNEKVFTKEEKLKSGYLICKTQNDIETSFIYKLYITDYFLNNNLASVLSSLIVNQDREENILKFQEIINNDFALNTLKENIQNILLPLKDSMPREYEEGINIFNNILIATFNVTLDIYLEPEKDNNMFEDYLIELDNISDDEVVVKDLKRRVLRKKEE